MTPVDLAYPFTGRWLVQNSPADRVPSHGTHRFASAYAIDFVPLGEGERTAPFTLRSLLRPEAPEAFPGFGRPILAPVSGRVAAVGDGAPDHPAHRGLASLTYAAGQARRAAEGWAGLAGNHVFIHSGAVIVALCHLQRSSVRVRAGDEVRAGYLIGACGNSGNSTEPHVHLQAFDNTRIELARAVPVRFDHALPRGGEVVEVAGPAGPAGFSRA